MNDAFRKAAILISSLDPKTADSLLDQMEPDQAAQIRQAVMEMESPSEEVQHRVMQEFLGKEAAQDVSEDGGVELDLSCTNSGHEPAEDDALPQPDHNNDDVSARTRHFEDADVESLAKLLRSEHPQTTAVVIAHLSPERAAEVISRLPEESQTDVLLRVARLENTPPEVIRDIEEEMRAMLVNERSTAGFSQKGLATVAAILEASPALRRADVCAGLAVRPETWRADRFGHTTESAVGRGSDGDERSSPLVPSLRPEGGELLDSEADALLARTVAGTKPYDGQPQNTTAGPPVTFATLESLSESSLAAVIRQADAQTAILALAGASHAFVQRILRGMPHREARQLEQKMQQLGPLRLGDVERAQGTLAHLAAQLIEEGKITLPTTQRFAVAV
jgi:flagellar motor switch protein FliG